MTRKMRAPSGPIAAPPVSFEVYGSPFTGTRLQEPIMWHIQLAHALWMREIALFHAEQRKGHHLHGHGFGMVVHDLSQMEMLPLPLRTMEPHSGYMLFPRREYVLRALIEWFGTNVGGCYFENLAGVVRDHSAPRPEHFVIFWDAEMKPKSYVNHGRTALLSILHRCTEECRKYPLVLVGFRDNCVFNPEEVPTEEDKGTAVLLHAWFATDRGKAFILRLVEEFRLARNSSSTLTRAEIRKSIEERRSA